MKDDGELAGMPADPMALVAGRNDTHQATETVDLRLRAGLMSSLGILKLRRKAELDADRCASVNMPAAGYDPRAWRVTMTGNKQPLTSIHAKYSLRYRGAQLE